MLYHLLYPLHDYFSALNVFRYITFRAAYATVTALLICFIAGPWFIRQLHKRHIIQPIREEGPKTHEGKKGTPTMGGILILAAIFIPCLLWCDLSDPYVVIALLTTLWMGIIGFVDDYLRVVAKRPKGLIGRYKLAGQLSYGLGLGLYLYLRPIDPDVSTLTSIPFLKGLFINFGWFYVVLVMLVVTGARFTAGVIGFEELRRHMESDSGPYLLLFGTGSGLAGEVTDQADFILEPLGRSGDYNHLSVRSAVAVVLDRLRRKR